MLGKVLLRRRKSEIEDEDLSFVQPPLDLPEVW